MQKRMRKRPRSARNNQSQDGPALVVVLVVAALAMLGYLAGEVAFAPRPHPFHWLAAVIGAAVGWGLGSIYLKLKGDIV
jgi:uncharacterized protein (DUF983 family)